MLSSIILLLATNRKSCYKIRMITILIKERLLSSGVQNANDLAVQMNISTSLAYRLWGGKFTRIDLQTIDRLCEYYGFEFEEIFVRKSKRAPKPRNGGGRL